MENGQRRESKWISQEPVFADFMEMPVHRVGETATVIFDHLEGRPVRLLGFSVSSSLTDFDIREAAFYHYQQLRERFNGT